MATQTKPRRASSAPQRRFGRGGAAPRRGPALRRRREPEPTGIKKLIGGLLPATAAKKATPNSKRGAAGGLALAAAAAGMAFKNRDRLAQLRHKRSGTPATENKTTAPPATADGSPGSGL
jgi:hypothetical protein